jgi:hypothetical protein
MCPLPAPTNENTSIIKHLLQHTSETYVYNHCNICNIRLKQLKHLKHTLATYVYNHCNICNIKIKHLQHTSETTETFETYTCNIQYNHCNICNIQIKHLQHTSETAKTYTRNIRVQPLQHMQHRRSWLHGHPLFLCANWPHRSIKPGMQMRPPRSSRELPAPLLSLWSQRTSGPSLLVTTHAAAPAPLLLFGHSAHPVLLSMVAKHAEKEACSSIRDRCCTPMSGTTLRPFMHAAGLSLLRAQWLHVLPCAEGI